jgi:hypothetical protein
MSPKEQRKDHKRECENRGPNSVLDSGLPLIDKPCMKLQHIAALALTGWFLITPPPQANGHYDTSAPLSRWKIEGGAGTRKECKETQALLTSRATKESRPSDVEAVKDAQCLPMDDPRLLGNP